MINLEQLKMALNLRNISRFQTHRMQTRQAVDQHSFRATALYCYFGGKEVAQMLFHDLEEAITGDLPSPIKKDLHGLDKYEAMRPPFADPREKKLGKLCDILELVLDLRDQMENFGRLSPKLMEIYEYELDRAKVIATELQLTKKVNEVLREVMK